MHPVIVEAQLLRSASHQQLVIAVFRELQTMTNPSAGLVIVQINRCSRRCEARSEAAASRQRMASPAHTSSLNSFFNPFSTCPCDRRSPLPVDP
jgi:hypothetical protein